MTTQDPSSRRDTSAQSQTRQLLTDRAQELIARIANIEVEQRQVVDDDSAEQALEREDDEVLDAVEQAALDELDAINRALRRLSDGSYGRCLACGEQIDARRLMAVPIASTCTACAIGAESRQQD